ncbi:MAG: hypothetical protein SCAL_000001 [Candidatus Syntrophoarchaeum caldarius]|uniref:Uncharacterized protein n=1 Tax=Candidatus Syntropharchaeum caldarium TaxID=1838285 RepID=A0A1F2PB94_9EURY|nr:MAG: hypothetical protein SCAL_000001 [Candidatus Syntrophoarchaeum caldarius]
MLSNFIFFTHTTSGDGVGIGKAIRNGETREFAKN